MHHGGKHCSMGYRGGKVDFFDFCCADKLSILEIERMVKESGITGEVEISWQKPNNIYSEGLCKLASDSDCLDMGFSVDSLKTMHVYVRSIDNMVEVCHSGSTRNANVRELKGKNIIYEEEAEHENEGEDGSDRNEDDEDYINLEKMLNDSDYDVEDEDDDLFDTHVDEGIERDVLRREHRPQVTVNKGIGNVKCDSNDSNLAPSDELHSMTESDNESEDVMKPGVRYLEFVAFRDMTDPTLKVGMLFKSLDEFKEACRSWAIKNRWQIKFKPNDKKRCKAVCGKGCGWYIWCDAMVRDPHTFQIKSGQFEHSCTKEHNIRQVTSKWLAKTYLEMFRANPGWNLNGFIKCVAEQRNIEVTISKAWRARKIAAKLIDGDENEQFANL